MAGKVTSMSTEARRKEQFNDTISNIRPELTIGKGRHQKTITGSVTVPLACCYVDMRYQGLRQHKRLLRLENKWDIRKLTNIVIVPHYEEHRFAIVDGQGRFLVAPKKGMDRLNATVLMDVPDNYEERLKFEAEFFIGQDSEVENVKPLEKHLARVIIGDEAATCLDRLFNTYGIKFVSKKGNREGSILGSYTDTYSIAKVHGEKCLNFIFSIIANAGWNKESNGYATYVMRALKEVWVAHPNDRIAMSEFLSNTLRLISPTLFSSNARTKYPQRDHRTACILYMEDMLCDGLGLKKKIYIDGEKKCKVIK